MENDWENRIMNERHITRQEGITENEDFVLYSRI